MRIRHKVPSIFSLSMVDVLCCALGCVILVWLLNAKQSEDEADERQQEIATLRARAGADRAESAKLLAEARSEYDRASARLAQLLAERKESAAALAGLKRHMGSLEKRKAALEADLAAARSEAAGLAGAVKKSSARVAALESDVRSARARVESERRRSAGLGADLERMAARLKKEDADLRAARTELVQARKQADTDRDRVEETGKLLAGRERELAVTSKSLEASARTRARLEAALAARDRRIKDLEAYRDRHAAALEREQALAEKLRSRAAELDEALGKVALLEKGGKEYAGRLEKLEKDRLAALAAAGAKVARLEKEKQALRLATENRFAGITLTGRRVLFLVDISGSMTMLDARTEAPRKWQDVCSTVGKLLRSLPDLEKYQVITFSRTPSCPLGSEGRWLTYDSGAAAQVEKALAAIKPSGGTNLYSAFAAAFEYRALGLDTVYLLSDGLPNMGEGVSATERLRLSESERSQRLGRYILTKLRSDWNRPQRGAAKVRINTIGFFFESPDLGAFLWALARDNDGSFVGMSSP